MNTSEFLASAARLGASLVDALPRVILGLAVILVAFGGGRLIRAAVKRSVRAKSPHANLQLALGRIAMATSVILGLLVAATVIFPTFTSADLVSTLGLGSVAIGFAFKDIFQNFFAGILMLITKPFVVGDQISFKEFEGNVEEIQTRATYLRTYDGRRIIIPNGELYINSVIVNTAFPRRRIEYDFGIGYGDDIDEVKRILLAVMGETEGISPDPRADVIVVGLAPSSVTVRARWWCDSHIRDVLIARDRVISEAKRRLTAAGIDLPFPTHQILLHDQTEAAEGDRRQQREGWPFRDA
ncbi:MAG: mechanosensitive ion channel family protein [Gemmatimonadaceae bacterium]